jgi:hypothetical protein
VDSIGIIVFCVLDRGISVANYKVCGTGRIVHIDSCAHLNFMNPIIVFLDVIHSLVFI